ncbi:MULTISPECIES: HlyD family efflux transporter periplasmic adaptor subunit [Alphaproteobacteria]|uniref:HlyD family secretion protein n=1 Tax=Alphaproteobacteria TaxID=28211 RepID=UPI003267BD4D
MRWKRTVLLLIGAVILAGGGYAVWINLRAAALPPGFAQSNGRLEAERVDIATKFPARVDEVLVKEGDTVTAGQVLVRMDTAELEAQLREAEASIQENEQLLDQAITLLAQRKSELTLAEQEYERSRILGEKGYTTTEKVQQRLSAKAAAEAGVNSAVAGIERAKAAVAAAVARAERIRENLKDYVLTAPRDGRIQYRLAQPGEVLGAGSRVLTLLDLTDVYMTIFLPTKDVGTLEIGAEARIVPDAAPENVVPATVSFVASEAQFTPKYVETESEREKLMFRVKVRLPPEILRLYSQRVKAGITGVAYVRLSPDAQWPDDLAVNLPKFESDE